MRGRRENFGDLWLLIKESVTLIECPSKLKNKGEGDHFPPFESHAFPTNF